MSSSTMPPQEVQAPPTEPRPPAASMEANASTAGSGPQSSDTVTPNLGNGSAGSSMNTDNLRPVSSSPSVVTPASPGGPPPPRLPGNNAAQEPIRANFPNTPNYNAPAPGFSYNVFPRNNAPIRPPQQPLMAQAVNLARPSPAALQPPVPRMPITSRPSFSYNIVSNANAIPAPGQQFQPATVPNSSHPRGDMPPPQVPPSSHSSQAVQPLGSNPSVARAASETSPATSQLHHSMAKGQLSAPGFSLGSSSQPSVAERKDLSSSSSTVDASQNVFPSSTSAQSGQTHVSISTSSTPVAAGLAHLNPTASLAPGGSTFSRPPVAPGNAGTWNALPATSLPSSSIAIRPATTEASNTSQQTAPFPSNPASFPAPFPQNIPQQMNQPHPPYHGVGPPQPVWLPHMQRPPFVPYQGPPPAPYPMPMRSVPPFTVLHPPGVPIVAAPGASLPASMASVPSTAVSTAETSPAVDDKYSSNPVHDAVPKKLDADIWTAHKTDTGAIYYYNSVTGESTYEKPASFKVEADKVTAQPTPVSWEKLPGTDWTLVTTDDGKKYYYDMKNKVSSWQIPQEVADIWKSQENSAAITAMSPSKSADKTPSLDTPALQTGGRDAAGLRGSTGVVPSSTLDLVKRKLQDASAPISSSPLPVPSALVGPTSDSSKTAENSTQETESNKEKPKDANGDANLSDSSSDSDDTDSEPTKEECIIKFKEMLKERGIAPFSKWEKELPKIVFDPRFKAVPGNAARRSLFEHFVRTRAEEERKEKKAAHKAAVEGFKNLLDEASEDIDIKTDYMALKRKWGNDPRFVALDRKEREHILNERVLSLKKAAEETRAVAISRFKSMLKERKDITSATRWSKVKDIFRDDPRYKAVKHDEREAFFNEYLLELKAAEDDAEKAEKSKRDEQEKLKRREQEMRKRKQREEQEMESLRLKVRKKEAEASFQALLVETIKDPKASWTESKPKLERDPQGRFTNSGLELTEMEKLFREHVKMLFERCASEFRALLSDVITIEAASNVNDSGKSILTSWSEAKVLLKLDARYSRLGSKERENIWRKYADEMLRRQKGTHNPTRSDTEGKGKSSTEQVGRSPRTHRRR